MVNQLILLMALCLLWLTSPIQAQHTCITEAEFGKGIPVQLNVKKTRREIVIQEDGTQIVIERQEAAAVELESAWTNGREIVIQFVDPTVNADLRNKVIRAARKWESHINLRFVFLSADQSPKLHGLDHADIRISFKGSGHWSKIGWYSSDTNDPQTPSMNLELTSQSDEEEIKRVVLHEFGHALGFHHEHQNPRGQIKWKQPEAMNYFLNETGWPRSQVEHNIFAKLEASSITATEFDSQSIMLYPIARGLTRDGFSVGWNKELSQTDIRSAAAVYPSWVDERGQARVRIAPGWLPAGACILSVQNSSPFKRLREFGHDDNVWSLELGDVVTHVNGKRVTNLGEYFEQMDNRRGRLMLRVRDTRTGNYLDLYSR